MAKRSNSAVSIVYDCPDIDYLMDANQPIVLRILKVEELLADAMSADCLNDNPDFENFFRRRVGQLQYVREMLIFRRMMMIDSILL